MISTTTGPRRRTDREAGHLDLSVAAGRNDVSMKGADILAGMVRGHVMTDENGLFSIRGLIPNTPIAFQAEVDGRGSDVISVAAIEPGFQRNGLATRIR